MQLPMIHRLGPEWRLLPEVELFEALERAEAHRVLEAAKMRVVLLAESHVFTSPDDLERCLARVPGAPPGISPTCEAEGRTFEHRQGIGPSRLGS